MFAAVVLALFAYSICITEIQCSIVQRESPVAETTASTELRKNLTLLKKIENIVIQRKSTTPSEVKIKKINISTDKNKPHVDIDGADISTSPLIEQGNRILNSNRKNLRAKDDVGRRQPKLFGSLGFLTNLGDAGLANAAFVNGNAFVKILTTAVPVPIGTPGYFTGFYEPRHYLPFSYPILYPVPSLANGYQNLVSGIPLIPSRLPQQISNVAAAESSHKNDTNFGMNDEANERLANEKEQESREAAATQTDLKKTIAPDVHDDNIDSAARNEEIESRQSSNTPRTPTTAATEPPTMNTTLASNDTVPTTSSINITESLPFYGYYGGNAQDVEQVIFTTEDPQQRYLKDYTEYKFAPPFERPAVFSPYQNVDSYPSSFVNSYSPGSSYPEFLNSVESDRYVYDFENRRNSNGFRPILK